MGSKVLIEIVTVRARQFKAGAPFSFDCWSLSCRVGCHALVIAVLALLHWSILIEPGAAGNQPATNMDPQPSQKAAKLTGHGGPVKAITVSGDGRFALSAGSLDYTMIYWSLSGQNGKILQKLDDHDGPVSAVAFIPGRMQAISASDDGALTIWNLKTGAMVKRMKQHTGKIAQVAVNNDGTYAASASWDRTIRVWDLATYETVMMLKGHLGPVNGVQFSADGKRLFTASYDGTIRQWDAATGTARGIIYKHGLGVNVMALTPKGDQLVFGALDGRAGVVNIETGEIDKILRPHDGPVLGLTISGKHGFAMLSSGKRKNGYIHVYALKGWEPKEVHHNPYTPIWALAFAGTIKHIYYGGLDDFINIWQVSPRKPFEVVASNFPRRFELSGDMDPGELQFARKCSVCHTLTPSSSNRGGPTLYKLFGRRAGTIPGFPYSDTLKTSTIVWNEETIDKLFSIGPEHYTPGTKMPLQRIKSAEERTALIAYLKRATMPK